LRKRIRDIVKVRASYDYKRIHILLQREGWKINHKRAYRIYLALKSVRARARRPREDWEGSAGGAETFPMRDTSTTHAVGQDYPFGN